MARQSNASRYPEMVRCENCGEDYSSTYKRCPFCDERPNGLFGGRRVDSRSGRQRNPLQMLGLVASLVLIIAALFIVFTKISPLIFQNDENTPVVNTPETSQTTPETEDPAPETTPGTSTEDPDTVPEGTDTPQTPNVSPTVIHAITLSRTDFTLVPGEIYSLTASVVPADADVPVIWTSSDPSILTVDEEGTVTNKNTTGETVVVTVTATCGGISAESVARCRSEEVPGVTPEPPNEGGNETSSSTSGSQTTTSTPTAVNKDAVIVNAESGLNIRSGPGSEHEKIASAANGATVTILEDCGNGWYKIDYGNGKIGYASSSFLKIK